VIAQTSPVKSTLMNTVARHGRQSRRPGVRGVVAVVSAALAAILISTGGVAAYAAMNLLNNVGPGVDISGADGAAPPAVGPIDGPVNILLVGSDSGGGNAAYGERGENLNDVTILLHISPVSHTAIAVSFPRDMFVPISGCESNPGIRKINEALYNGGLACAVSTVSALTGLEIPYAAMIEFDGVIAMSNALGGVDVCVGTAIHDLQIGFDLEAGTHTLQGFPALQFLRSRHGVGDGSDTGRISNQQNFLSAMMRKVKSSEVLTNPLTLYGLAQAATQNMSLSTSLNHLDTMYSMAVALKDIPLSNIVFAQYPGGSGTSNGQNGILPRKNDAKVLMDAIASDLPVVVTEVGGGVIAGDDVVETTAPVDPSATPTIAPETPTAVTLPSTITGQAATEQTCTAGQTF
jgi:LCP family protein required for cell wall assembly